MFAQTYNALSLSFLASCFPFFNESAVFNDLDVNSMTKGGSGTMCAASFPSLRQILERLEIVHDVGH
jgi:hypothetical protein